MSTLARIPLTRYDRWAWLARFVEEWRSPNRAISTGVTNACLDAAEQRMGYGLPLAVREWYCRFGNRFDVWCAQDKLLPPEGLRIEGDLLVFLVESQGVVQWGIPINAPDMEDPFVLLDVCELGEEPYVESNSFSEFAVAFALYNFKFVSDHIAAGSATIGPGSLATELFNTPILTPWHWPKFPTVFAIWNESILEVQGRFNEKCWITLSSRNQRSLDEDLMRLGSLGIRLSPVV